MQLSNMTMSTTGRRTVRFAAAHDYTPPCPQPPPLTDEDISCMWYSEDEHEMLKNEAREDMRQMMIRRVWAAAKSRGCGEEASSCDGDETEATPRRRPQHLGGDCARREEEEEEEEEEPYYRGLEHRVSTVRSRRRCVAVRAVLEVQRRLREGRVSTDRDPAAVVSSVSRRFTRLSAEEARLTGRTDFLQAYRAYRRDASVMESLYESRKRKVSSPEACAVDVGASFVGSSDEGRRVRARVCISVGAS